MARAKKELPKVSVLERRLKNPFGAPSVEITLRTGADVVIRVGSNKVRTGRIHDLVYNKGWEYVTPEELDGRPEDFGFAAVDGRLVRGEHGEEVLLKMDRQMFEAVQARKAAINLKNLGGKATREAVAQDTAAKFGDEAGETVFRNIEVNDGRERVELDADDIA